MPFELLYMLVFFFNDTATTEIYTLSLHDALPIFGGLLEDLLRPAAGLFLGGPRLGQPALGRPQPGGGARLPPAGAAGDDLEIGRAHLCTPGNLLSRMPSSALQNKWIVVLMSVRIL